MENDEVEMANNFSNFKRKPSLLKYSSILKDNNLKIQKSINSKTNKMYKTYNDRDQETSLKYNLLNEGVKNSKCSFYLEFLKRFGV